MRLVAGEVEVRVNPDNIGAPPSHVWLTFAGIDEDTNEILGWHQGSGDVEQFSIIEVLEIRALEDLDYDEAPGCPICDSQHGNHMFNCPNGGR